jgi:hypothetical protein
MGIEFNILRALFMLMPALWTTQDAVLFSVGSTGVRVTEVVGLLIAFCFARHLFVWHPDPELKIIRLLIWAAMIAAVPAVLLASDFKTGIGYYLRRFEPCLLLLATAHSVRDARAFRRMFLAMLMGGALLMPFLVAAKLSGQTMELGGYSRLVAGGYKPQGLGQFLGTFVGLAVAGIQFWPRWWLKVLIGCAVAGLYLTLYRTGWVICILIAGPLVLLLRQTRFLRLVCVVAFLLLCLNWQTVAEHFLRYSKSTSTEREADSVLSGRLSVNKTMFNQFAQMSELHWLSGIGFYSSLSVSERLIGVRYVIHNDFLAILIETGPFSLVAYCSLLFVVLKAGILRIRTPCRAEQLCAAWLSVLFVGVLVVAGMALAWYVEVLTSAYVYGMIGMMFGVFPRLPCAARRRDSGTVPPLHFTRARSNSVSSSDWICSLASV